MNSQRFSYYTKNNENVIGSVAEFHEQRLNTLYPTHKLSFSIGALQVEECLEYKREELVN